MSASDCEDRCVDIQAAISLSLDGHLAQSDGEAVRQHVSACAPCAAFLSDCRALAHAVRAEPVDRLPAGFAAEVRRRALQPVESEPGGTTTAPVRRRPWEFWSPFGPVWQRHGTKVAAGVMALLGLALAYQLGREHGDRRWADASHPWSGASMGSDAAALRAARGLAADLAVIDRVSEPLRIPLVQAQLQHFDLPAWARRQGGSSDGLTRALVRLVHEADVLAEHHDVHGLVRLKSQARELASEFRDVELSVVASGSGLGDRRRQVVRVAGRGLDAEMVVMLNRVLEVKEAVVFGDHRAVLRAGARDLGACEDLAIPFAMTLVTGFEEAGVGELAYPWARVLTHQMPEMVDVLPAALIHDIQTPTGRLGDQLQARLAQILGTTAGNAEVRVVQEEGAGWFALQIVVEGTAAGEPKK